MPRRLTPPHLDKDGIRLEPLARALAPDMAWVLEPDEDIARFTYIPTVADEPFLERWLGRYEDGWETGENAGFIVRDADRKGIGFAAYVRLDLEGQQGELGYVIARDGRGRGAATTALSLLTDWGFRELGLQRIELRIDPRNTGSEKVAERAGYRQEGVLRSVAFKEGLRTDVGVWSRLAQDSSPNVGA